MIVPQRLVVQNLNDSSRDQILARMGSAEINYPGRNLGIPFAPKRFIIRASISKVASNPCNGRKNPMSDTQTTNWDWDEIRIVIKSPARSYLAPTQPHIRTEMLGGGEETGRE